MSHSSQPPPPPLPQLLLDDQHEERKQQPGASEGGGGRQRERRGERVGERLHKAFVGEWVPSQGWQGISSGSGSVRGVVLDARRLSPARLVLVVQQQRRHRRRRRHRWLPLRLPTHVC